MRFSRSLLTALVAPVAGLGLVSLTGCAHVEAYDRSKLAHPTMTTTDISGPGEEHVRAVQEGATGGSIGVGGGCGCN
jgi:hypothetical protein